MTPNRCYDLLIGVIAVALLGGLLAVLCVVSIPVGARIFGFAVVLPALAWTIARLFRTQNSFHAAVVRAADASGEPIQRFRSTTGAVLELARHHDAIESRLRSQAETQARIERDLGASTTLLQTAYEALTDAILVIDRGGSLVLLNPAAGPMLGLNASHVGRPLVEVLRTPQVHDVLRKSVEARERCSGQAELSRSQKRVAIVASPLPDPTGGTVLLVQDETELRKLERMRRDFVSNVSHELKTPLTTIQAYADTLLDGGLQDSETATVFLERIVQQAERLGSMIVDMLDLARLETELEPPTPEPIAAANICQHTLDNHRPIAEAAGVELATTVPDDAVFSADGPTLRSILDNLVQNAIEHTPEGGRVTLRVDDKIPASASPVVPNQAEANAVEQRGQFLCLHVSDTGKGIPRDLQDRVFERFFRVDKSRNRKLGGSGLGLAIVKHASERLGGQVSVESRLGAGSTFHVILPGTTEPTGASEGSELPESGPISAADQTDAAPSKN